MDLDNWIDNYARAWETADVELVTSLFTEDASYRSSPFREPYRGHDQMRTYWRQATATQRETRVRMGGRSSTAVASQSNGGRRCWTPASR